MRTLIGSLYSERAFNLLGMLVINLDVESKFDDFNCYLDANRGMRVYIRDDNQVTKQKYCSVGGLLTYEVQERCLKFSNFGESNNLVYLLATCCTYERDLRMRHKARSNRQILMKNPNFDMIFTSHHTPIRNHPEFGERQNQCLVLT